MKPNGRNAIDRLFPGAILSRRSYTWRRRQVSLPKDSIAGLVVALVALPLCIGIAVASHAPISAGLIAGIVGGLVVPLISRSPLGISGPAAGLTAIAAQAIDQLGFTVFLTVTVLAGVFQLLLPCVRGDVIGYFFPSPVIYGMLAGIGGILLVNQTPRLLGYAPNLAGSSLLLGLLHPGALLVGLVSLFLLVGWEHPRLAALNRWVPGALVAIVGGTATKFLWEALSPMGEFPPTFRLALAPLSLSSRPLLYLPALSHFQQASLWGVALTVAIVASLETLLSVEAVDRIDPLGRRTPKRRELFAQGIGNIVSGLFGGLPITQVIVRSSTAVQAGGRGRMTALFHGVFLLGFVLLLSPYLAQVPIGAVAAILVGVAYKLLKPQIFQQFWRMGFTRFVPFLSTFLGVLLLDLLMGVGLGLAIAAVFILWENYQMGAYAEAVWEGRTLWLRLGEQVTFLNKAHLAKKLSSLPDNTHLIVDATRARFVDPDVWELLAAFNREAKRRNITVEIRQPAP